MNIESENEIRKTFNIKLIKDTINNINKNINEENNKNKTAFELELYIMTEYPEFYSNYPFLVKKLCKKDDIELLYKMFDNLNDVELGNKTLSNVESTLGNELAQKFIYPKINK